MVTSSGLTSEQEYATLGDKEAPATAEVEQGVVALERLPAEWYNYYIALLTVLNNTTKAKLDNIIAELDGMLTAAGITPNANLTTQMATLLGRIPFGADDRAITPTTDYNTIVKSGPYYGNAGEALHGPNTSTFLVLHVQYPDLGYAFQIAQSAVDVKELYTRLKLAGIWQDWAKMWTSANDGATSSLDAGVLDGQMRLYFAVTTSESARWTHLCTLPAVSGSSADMVTIDLSCGQWTYGHLTQRMVMSNRATFHAQCVNPSAPMDADIAVYQQGDGRQEVYIRCKQNYVIANATVTISGLTVDPERGHGSFAAYGETTTTEPAGTLIWNSYDGNVTAWNAGNDGAGSDCDAGLFAGLPTSRFSYYNEEIVGASTDWNTLILPRTYTVTSISGAHAPSTAGYAYGGLDVERDGKAFCKQTYTPHDNAAYCMQRIGYSEDGGVAFTVWRDWIQMWHTANGIAGSVVNSEKVAGVTPGSGWSTALGAALGSGWTTALADSVLEVGSDSYTASYALHSNITSATIIKSSWRDIGGVIFVHAYIVLTCTNTGTFSKLSISIPTAFAGDTSETGTLLGSGVVTTSDRMITGSVVISKSDPDDSNYKYATIQFGSVASGTNQLVIDFKIGG